MGKFKKKDNDAEMDYFIEENKKTAEEFIKKYGMGVIRKGMNSKPLYIEFSWKEEKYKDTYRHPLLYSVPISLAQELPKFNHQLNGMKNKLFKMGMMS